MTILFQIFTNAKERDILKIIGFLSDTAPDVNFSRHGKKGFRLAKSNYLGRSQHPVPCIWHDLIIVTHKGYNYGQALHIHVVIMHFYNRLLCRWNVECRNDQLLYLDVTEHNIQPKQQSSLFRVRLITANSDDENISMMSNCFRPLQWDSLFLISLDPSVTYYSLITHYCVRWSATCTVKV